MSAEFEDLPSWGRGRWSVTVLLLGLLHLGALFALSDLGPARVVREPDTFEVRLFTESQASAVLLDAHALNNPTLLATVNRRGFSGPAWLNIDPPPFRLPDWREEQRWLTQDTSGLGLSFRGYVRTNLGTSLSVARAPAPPESPVLGGVGAVAHADIFVTGDLAQRALLDRPELTALPAPDLLVPSAVEVLVDHEGFVFSPRLRHRPLIVSPEQAAAQRRADQRALALTRELRFAAANTLPGTDEFPFTKGEVTFNWTTLPPATTNRNDR